MPKYPPLATRDAVLAYVRDQLAAAVRDAGHGWHWPALATGNDARVVVLRDADPARATVTWFTDRRSAKVAALAADPRCGLLFYHADHRTQLRIAAEAREVTDPGARADYWARVRGASRANYATRAAPGTPQPGATTDLPADGTEDGRADAPQAAEQFAVYRATILGCDFVQLLDVGAYRSQWRPRAADSFTFVTP